MTASILAILLSLRLMGIPCQIVTVSVSAYTNSGGVYPFAGLTASGVQTGPQTCACGSLYDFGTVFIVNGRVYVCQDRGGAIDDGKLDLWHESEAEAIQFGRHTLNVVVVK